jgi:phage-related protein
MAAGNPNPRKAKPLFWCRSSKKSYDKFPEEVQDDAGYELDRVQRGKDPFNFNSLRGMGSGVMEIKADHAGDTYRAVYVAKFEEAVYVLDAFQKKSPSGSSLPKNVRDRIEQRYKEVKNYRPAKRG